MSPQVGNIQNSLYAAIEFSKKQQWVITNYVILVYGAIFGLSKWATNFEKNILTGLVFVACVYACFLLISIQGDLGRYRSQLESIHNHWLSPDEREKLIFRGYGSRPALRGGWFLVGLLGVIVIGASLVGHFMWR